MEKNKNFFLSILYVSIVLIAIFSSGCIDQPETAIQPDEQYVVDGEDVNQPETTIQPDDQIVADDQKFFVLNSLYPIVDMEDNRGGIFRVNYSTNLESFRLEIVSPDGNSNEETLRGSFGEAWMKIPYYSDVKMAGTYRVIVEGMVNTEPYHSEYVTFIDQNYSYKGGKLSIINLSVDSWSTTPGPSSSNPLWWIDSASIWVKNSGDLPSYVRILSVEHSQSTDDLPSYATVQSVENTPPIMMESMLSATGLGWVDAGETKLFKIENDYGSLHGFYWVDVAWDKDKTEDTFPFEIYLISRFDEDNTYYHTSENPYEIVSLWNNYLLLDTSSGTINVIKGQQPWIT